MSKESSEYRAQMLRRLEHKLNGPKPTEVLEAEEVVAKFREEQEQARAAIPRFDLPLPKDDLCPACFYLHGRETLFKAVTHPKDPKNLDLMRCPVCGHTEEREA